MSKFKHTLGPWNIETGIMTGYPRSIKAGIYNIINHNGISRAGSVEGEANALLISLAPEMLEGIIKTYSEFLRIKNRPDISFKDSIYLDGVLAVLDTYLKYPIERATGMTIDDAIKAHVATK